MSAKRIFVTGIVPGVGFRPFVYGLAVRHHLSGWVCNTSAGVDMVIQGEPVDVEGFVESLSAGLPPLARIDSMKAGHRERLAGSRGRPQGGEGE